MTRQLIVENCGFFKMEVLPRTLTEAVVQNEGRTGRYPILMEIKGPMTIVGRKNANGRTYPIDEINKAISKLKPQLESLCVFGELDHPEKSRGGETSLKYVSHIIKDLWVEKREMTVFNEDGHVERGTYDVLMAHWLIRDSKWGRELANLLEIGCAVGTSMRGFGELSESGAVANYLLKTIDAVDDPSSGTRIIAGLTEGALPSAVNQDVLTDKQSAGIAGLLADTLKMLNEDSDLAPTKRLQYLEAMEGTVKGLSFGEGQERAVQSLMGEIATMKTKTLKFLESAKSRTGAAISESGDEATKPGMQSNPVKKQPMKGGELAPEGDVFEDDSEDMFLDDGEDFSIDGDTEDEDDVPVNPDLQEGFKGTEKHLEDEDDVKKHPDAPKSTEPDADSHDDEDEGDVEKHPDIKESGWKKVALDARERYRTAESAVRGLKEYALCLEATVEAMRKYALDLEEGVTELRDVNIVFEEALDQTKDYALTVENTLTEMTGYARNLETGVEALREQVKRLETAAPLNESKSADAIRVKAELQEKTAQLDKAVSLIEKLRNHTTEQTKELEAAKARRAGVNEALAREVRAAINVSPALDHFKAELLEAKDRRDLEARIQKYVRLLESASNMRVDLPPMSKPEASTPKPITEARMYGMRPGMR